MRNLLLADASPMMQRIVELTFAEEDIRVSAVRDGEEAARQIVAEPPDIVLVDHALPKRSGYEVTALIKGRADLAHIPVLLLSGAFEPVDRVRAAQVGCDGVVSKPFEPPQLVARVRELLARPQPRAASAVPMEAGETAADGAAGSLDVPTISALLGMPSRESIDIGGSHDPIASEPPHDVAEAETGPPHPTHLTDLSELAEALGAFSRRMAAPETIAAVPGAEPHASPTRPHAPRDPHPATGSHSSAEMHAAAESQASTEPSASVEPDARVELHAPADTEDLVEEITRRVLERMTPEAIHAVLSTTVSRIAGQLLSDELKRRRTAAPPSESGTGESR